MRKLKREELSRRIDATGMKPAPWAVANGLNDESVRMWLNGGRDPKIGSIRKLADALNCTVEDISSWVHEVDKSKLAQYERELEEITGLWVHLTVDQRKSILDLVRTIAGSNMKINIKDEEKV